MNKFNHQVLKHIEKYPDLNYDGSSVNCLTCNVRLMSFRIYDWELHLGSPNHFKAKNPFPYWKFVCDLVFTMNISNIPLSVLDKESFRSFWETYSPQWKLPTTNQLRNNLSRVEQLVLNIISHKLKDKNIWVSVSEMRDAKGNQVGNVVVRVLKPNNTSSSYLIASKRLKTVSSQTMIQLVTKALERLNIDRSQVLMIVTDTKYACKTGEKLRNIYPNLLHVTCMIHVLHAVIEEIRRNYPDIDSLIFSMKKVFVKSPKRQKFRKAYPGIPEPPQPILKQRADWLEAALYYHHYYEQVKSFILEFTPRESAAVKDCHAYFRNERVKADIHTVYKNYSTVVNSLKELDDSKLPLEKSLKIIDQVKSVLETLIDDAGVCVSKKFNDLLNKNPDYKKLLHINQCLMENYLADEFQQYFAYANITTIDVQQSFSHYKAMYKSQQKNLSKAATEKLLLIQSYCVLQESLHSQ